MSVLHMIGLTDPGRMRAGNEDSIATRPDLGLVVLADGMGGHQAGEVASHMAVDVISRHFAGTPATDDQPLETRITEAIQRANAEIYDAAHARAECAGMGSTVVTAVFRNGDVVFGHVGDSRLYRLRAGELRQLTEDHSVIQELVNRGLYTAEEARQSVGKNLVTRALGVDPAVQVDVAQTPVEDDDVYLLCSDGLNDVVSDQEIARVISEAGGNLHRAAAALVTLANERGGPDNISVILVGHNTAAAEIVDDEFRITRHDKFLIGDTEI